MKKIIAFIFLVSSVFVVAQNDSINKLEEIVLKGSFSSSLNTGYTIETITDSILKREQQSLGNLLQNQANLYFKQNGNGMVSSISLRGTGASQTGVYWNGIAINSALNGQTDFNTMSANSFDVVEIKKGGSSVLLGSGAIGGAINLSDKIIFQKRGKANLNFGFGSYETLNENFTGVLSSENIFVKISLGAAKSKNDYPYLDTDLKNDNGEYKNENISTVFAFQFSPKNQINFYTSYFENDRNTSRTLTALNNSKLLNTDSRFLLDWKNLGDRYTSSLKFAYLTENFTYFFDKDAQNFSEGNTNSFISKYDFNYFLNNSIFFNIGLEYKKVKGWGTSIQKENQNIFNHYLLFHHQPIQKLTYNLSIRKGYSSIFEIPWIYSIDAAYNLSNQLIFKAAFSTNYRVPTFNDLYWNPGGNPDLKSEKSKSAEIGLDYNYKIFRLNITSYIIKNKDLIKWQPVSGNFWQPQNIKDVTNMGLEISTTARKKFNEHFVGVKIQYDYTVSEDNSTNKQLIYVPYHKTNAILDYQYKKWNLIYNLQYTGEVYITTSNTEFIDAYFLSNLNINRFFLHDKINIAFKVNNLFDKSYQSVSYRPMPNRNFTLNINLKI